MYKTLRCAALIAVLALMSGAPVAAKTFRWANNGDSNSMDPYARMESFLLSFNGNMYEPLVRRDKDLKLEPALATEWSQPRPDVWRFKLRQGVTFHDGTPFTADDVVFSYERAANPGSNLTGTVATIQEVKKVDDLTVDIVTKGPDPILHIVAGIAFPPALAVHIWLGRRSKRQTGSLSSGGADDSGADFNKTSKIRAWL